MESKYFKDCRPFVDVQVPIPAHINSAMNLVSYSEKFLAKVVDLKDEETINEIVRFCQNNGIGNLRLIDGEFVKHAILSARGIFQPRMELFKVLCPICVNRGFKEVYGCHNCMMEEEAGFYPDVGRIRQLFYREAELLEVKKGEDDANPFQHADGTGDSGGEENRNPPGN